MSKIFSIKDNLANYFQKPVVFATRGEAIRAFTSLVSSSKDDSPFSKFPSDFTLYELADFDDALGRLVSFPDPIRLGSGSDFISVSVDK